MKNGTRELMNFLRFATRKYNMFQKDQACCCGTTMAQSQVIMEIGYSRDISLVQLATTLGLDRSTMSRTVHNLVELGLVHRVEDSQDRRYVVLRLSDDGKVTFRYIEEQVMNYLDEVLADIPRDKKDQVLESLALLETALEKQKCCGDSNCRCGCREGS
jgi:DNA-binding MarR family transcriptional regulator